jgi:hypothetical protein
MNLENKTWGSIKAEYLRKVEKALSSVKNPRKKDVLEDVRSHLDRRFAELGSEEQTWENFQAIITQMGPASDYAELLASEADLTKQSTSHKHLLWLMPALIGITAVAMVAVVAITAIVVIFYQAKPVTTDQFRENFYKNIESFNIDTATFKDVVETFGEPVEYIWHNQTFEKKDLPIRYIIVYPDDFHIFMSDGKIVELRHEGPGTGYAFLGRLKVGAPLDEVIEVLGEPKETVAGEENLFADAILYKDIEGRKGHCYYARQDYHVRLWFADYKLWAIYETRSDYGQRW